MIRKHSVYFWAGLSTLLALGHVFPSVFAQTVPSSGNTGITQFPFAGPGVTGEASFAGEPKGADLFKAHFRGLRANSRYTLFLAHDPLRGQVPGQFLGEFTTDGSGVGDIGLLTEVLDARSVTPAESRAFLPCAPSDGCFQSADGHSVHNLNWIRLYFGDGPFTRFGDTEASAGGGLVASTTTPLP